LPVIVVVAQEDDGRRCPTNDTGAKKPTTGSSSPALWRDLGDGDRLPGVDGNRAAVLIDDLSATPISRQDEIAGRRLRRPSDFLVSLTTIEEHWRIERLHHRGLRGGGQKHTGGDGDDDLPHRRIPQAAKGSHLITGNRNAVRRQL
jgi:hypothetical protein